METIAICTNKGGVGKTTITVGLTAYLARMGLRVLAVDMDGQANLTWSAGVRLEPGQPTIMDALVDLYKNGHAELPIVHADEGFDVVPAAESLANADVAFANYPQRWSLLRRLIRGLDGAYDYVLMDCPPAFSTGSTSALIAADYVLVVTEASMLPLLGVKRMYDAVAVAKTKNPSLSVLGIAVNRWRGTANNKLALAQLKEAYPGYVFDTVVRESTVLSEAPATGRSIFAYKPFSNGSKDLAALAEEVIKRIQQI